MLTGKTRLRPHYRVFAPTLYVLEVEEIVHKKIDFIGYSSRRFRWKDATARDIELLNAIDPDKPIIDELRRIAAI